MTEPRDDLVPDGDEPAEYVEPEPPFLAPEPDPAPGADVRNDDVGE